MSDTIIDKIDKKMDDLKNKEATDKLAEMTATIEKMSADFDTKLKEAQDTQTAALKVKDDELVAQKSEFEAKLEAVPDRKSATTDDFTPAEKDAKHIEEYRSNKEYALKTDQAFFDDLLGTKRY